MANITKYYKKNLTLITAIFNVKFVCPSWRLSLAVNRATHFNFALTNLSSAKTKKEITKSCKEVTSHFLEQNTHFSNNLVLFDEIFNISISVRVMEMYELFF